MAAQQNALGKFGVWTWLDQGSYADAIEVAQTCERLGYSALWLPEAVGRDPFTLIASLVPHTEQLLLATGIASIYARDAMAMNATKQSLNELSGGRLVLGLGVSHSEMVTAVRQHEYGKPVATMRGYLQRMKDSFYVPPPPERSGPVLLAALREKMLGLAAEAADGAHPYFVTPEHTAKARGILGEGKLLAPEQKVLLVSEPSEARRLGRKFAEGYLGLVNYRNNLLELGFDATDFEDGGSNRLIDAIVAWGDETAIMRRVEEHWQAGADHVCIQPLRPDGEMGPDMKALRALAPGG